MSYPTVLPITDANALASADEHEKPRSKKCACAITRRPAVLRLSTMKYDSKPNSSYDEQRIESDQRRVSGGVLA